MVQPNYIIFKEAILLKRPKRISDNIYKMLFEMFNDKFTNSKLFITSSRKTSDSNEIFINGFDRSIWDDN